MPASPGLLPACPPFRVENGSTSINSVIAKEQVMENGNIASFLETSRRHLGVGESA